MDLGVNAYIPDNYLPDTEIKIEIYKRIAALTSDEEKAKLTAEINDRFGIMPPGVENLFALSKIKSLANRLLVRSVVAVGTGLNIRFFADHQIQGGTLVKIAEKYGNTVKFNSKKGFVISSAYRLDYQFRKNSIIESYGT